MGSSSSRLKTGSFIGTGATINVDNVGFRPSKVVLRNVTGICVGTWTKTMADASMFKIVDSGVGTTDITFVTTLGVTPRSGGFSIGADTDVNVSAQVVHWECTE